MIVVSKSLALIIIALLWQSCAHSHNDELNSKISSNIVVGESTKAHRYGNLYFSGQPTMDSIKNLKNEGFATIINLRTPSEYDESLERKAAEASGFTYINVPFAKSDYLDDSYIDKLTQAVVDHRKEGKVLIHCSSGNRVGIWLAGHFLKDHSYEKQLALSTAKKLGLTQPQAIKKAEAYLDSK